MIRPGTLPDSIKVVARTDQDEIMGVRHITYALEGVQYHPESSSLTLEVGPKLPSGISSRSPGGQIHESSRAPAQVEQIPEIYRDFMLILKSIPDTRHSVLQINGLQLGEIFTYLRRRHHYEPSQVRERLQPTT